METTQEHITPDKAQEYLAHNIGHNRSVTKSHVTTLAAAIKKGHWRVNGDTIAFDDEGNLIDGQHRLLAVIQARKPIDTIVVRGVCQDSFATKDVGRRRRISDVLSIHGVANSRQVAAVLRLIHASNNMAPGWNGITNLAAAKKMDGEEAIALYEAHPDVYAVSAVGLASKCFAAKYVRYGIAGFLRYWFHTISEEDAKSFFDKFNSGAGLAADDPILVLRERLISIKADSRHTPSERELMAYVIKAWNFWRRGSKVKLARYTAQHEFPTPI